MRRAPAQIAKLIELAIARLIERGIPSGALIDQVPASTLPPTGNTGTGYTPGDISVTTGKIADGAVTIAKLSFDPATQAELDTHESDTTSVHGIADTSTLYRAGGTDVAVADGGTGASTAAAARSNLGTAPAAATYITQTADSELSAEQVLSSLATGYMKVANSTGVISSQAVPIPVADGGTGVIAIPAFSAYKNASQSINDATFTKIAFQAEDFDSNGNYDHATNYRFLPTIAGTYLIMSRVGWSPTLVDQKLLLSSIYKNGTRVIDGTTTTSGTSDHGVFVAGLIQMNGSTDYVEIYGYQETGGSASIYGGTNPKGGFFAGIWVGP